MNRYFDILITASGTIVGFAAFVIGITVTYDVLGRSLFDITNTWVADLNTYIMGFITFVGAGYALREDAHVGVEIVAGRLSGRLQALMRMLSDLVVLVVSVTLLWLSIQFWWQAWTSGEQSWGLFTVRLWIPYTSLPVGLALLLAVQLRRTVRAWRGLFY